MLIPSHIHNAANCSIAKNSWQSYFKKFEVFFSRQQPGAINLFLHFLPPSYNGNDCFTDFRYFNSNTFFGTIQKTEEKKSKIYLSLLKHKFHNWFSEPLLISRVIYFHSLYNSFALIWNKNSFIFSLVFLSFLTSVNIFLKFLVACDLF